MKHRSVAIFFLLIMLLLNAFTFAQENGKAKKRIANGILTEEEQRAFAIKLGDKDLGNNILQTRSGHKYLFRKRAKLNFPTINSTKKYYSFYNVYDCSFIDQNKIFFKDFNNGENKSSPKILDLNTNQLITLDPLPNEEKTNRSISNEKSLFVSSSISKKKTDNLYIYYFANIQLAKDGSKHLPYVKISLPLKLNSYLYDDSYHDKWIILKTINGINSTNKDPNVITFYHRDTNIVSKYNVLNETEEVLSPEKSEKELNDSILHDLSGRIASDNSAKKRNGGGMKEFEEGIFTKDKQTGQERKILDFGERVYFCPDEATRIVMLRNPDGSYYMIVVDDDGKNIRKIDLNFPNSNILLNPLCVSSDKKTMLIGTDNQLIVLSLDTPLY